MGLGAEYYFFRTIALRLGARYNNAFDFDALDFNSINSLIVLSGGAGINIGNALAVDYAYTPMGDIGTIHRITAKIKFGESRYERRLAEQNAEFIPRAIEVPSVNVEGGLIRAVSFQPNVPDANVREWTLSIKTSEGQIVKTFKGTGEVPKDLTWDGTNQIGQISSSGIDYVFDFQARNYDGNVIKTIGQIVQAQRQEFVLPEDRRYIPRRNREMLVAPITLLISSETKERRIVPFVMENKEIRDVGSWRFNIKDRAGKVIRFFAGEGDIPSYLVWDGRDFAGNLADNPSNVRYELEIKGKDGRSSTVKETKVLKEPFAIVSKNKKLKMTKKIYFEKNYPGIHESMQKRLEEIAEEIKKHKDVQVYIQGHSSGEGDRARNILLSQERAKAGLRYLVEKHNVSPLSITTVGYGSDVPAVPNETEEQRVKNRRTEVIIMGETD